MAQYLLLIYENARAYDEMPPDGWTKISDAHGVFAKSVVEAGGKILAGEALQPVATATSVRGALSGDQVVTDGPFVETKETLGGFYMVEATDLDQAIAFAKQCPTVDGGIEVRPVWDTSQPPGA